MTAAGYHSPNLRILLPSIPPEKSPAIGYVTAYLTQASWFFANTTPYLGITTVGHPRGILDEILYYIRGLETIVEASIFFAAFAIAAFLDRRSKQ